MQLRQNPELILKWAGTPPDPWQSAVLRSTADRLSILATRQGGKTHVSAGKVLRKALVDPKSLILVLAPSKNQSAEFLARVRSFYSLIDGKSLVPLAYNRDEVFRLRLSNGSRIIALPNSERTIRGYAGVSLLVLDEASRIGDDLYYAVRPMLATSGGHILALSTPWGKQGWFYNEWMGEQLTGPRKWKDRWDRYAVTADKCPRFTPEFLEEERLNNPLYEQEYFLKWIDPEGAVFREQDIAAATKQETDVWSLDWGK